MCVHVVVGQGQCKRAKFLSSMEGNSNVSMLFGDMEVNTKKKQLQELEMVALGEQHLCVWMHEYVCMCMGVFWRGLNCSFIYIIYNLLTAENEFTNKKYPSIFQKEYFQYRNNYYTWKKAHSENFFQIASDLGLF